MVWGFVWGFGCLACQADLAPAAAPEVVCLLPFSLASNPQTRTLVPGSSWRSWAAGGAHGVKQLGILGCPGHGPCQELAVAAMTQEEVGTSVLVCTPVGFRSEASSSTLLVPAVPALDSFAPGLDGFEHRRKHPLHCRHPFGPWVCPLRLDFSCGF